MLSSIFFYYGFWFLIWFCCMVTMQMSVVTDSPVHSSSSDDFIAFLDAELDASSPDSSPDKEVVKQDDELQSVRCSSSLLVLFHILYLV